MPRPVKPDKPVVTEPVVEPIQGTTIVIIHPGSAKLQLGRATDHLPHSLPHVIARKIINKDYSHIERRSLFHRKGLEHEESEEKRTHGLKSAKTLLQQMRISGGYRKSRVTASEIAAYNKQVQPDLGEEDGTVAWTDVENFPDYVIGEQALNLQPTAPYSCRWPMLHGQLNIHDGVNGSLTSVAADLATLWGSAIETYLDIPVKDLSFYRAVLLVPDIFDRRHVKTMLDVLLNRLKFSCAIISQESVCATFGSGLPSACVVDVGAQKTNICCVEDGLSLPNTRMTLNYGGDDITRCLCYLLQMSNFPYRSFDENDPFDIQLLQELKETFCHLSLDIPAGHVHEFQVMRPSDKTQVYQLRLGDEPMLAPLALFVPDLFGLTGEELIKTFPESLEHDSEDVMDDKYLLEKRDAETKKTKGETEGDSQPQEIINVSQVSQREHSRLEPLRYDGMSLDEAIMYSIEQCNSPETKRKMYATVLLVGGGMFFKGADDFLLKRLQYLLPQNFNFIKPHMEVIAKPKENDPRVAGWKGATVVSILDSSQELWISRKEWNDYGVRLLRERCMFQWTTNMDRQ